jgi:hypothetical protein
VTVAVILATHFSATRLGAPRISCAAIVARIEACRAHQSKCRPERLLCKSCGLIELVFKLLVSAAQTINDPASPIDIFEAAFY